MLSPAVFVLWLIGRQPIMSKKAKLSANAACGMST